MGNWGYNPTCRSYNTAFITCFSAHLVPSNQVNVGISIPVPWILGHYKTQTTRLFLSLHAMSPHPAHKRFISAEKLVLQRGPRHQQVC